MTRMHCLIFQNCLRKVKAKFGWTTWSKLTYTHTPLLKCIICSSHQWDTSLLLTVQSTARTVYAERAWGLLFYFCICDDFCRNSHCASVTANVQDIDCRCFSFLLGFYSVTVRWHISTFMIPNVFRLLPQLVYSKSLCFLHDAGA